MKEKCSSYVVQNMDGAQNSFINEEHSVIDSVRVRLSCDEEGLENLTKINFLCETVNFMLK